MPPRTTSHVNMSQPPARPIFSPTVHTLPDSAISCSDIKHVLEHGYVVLNDVFTKSDAEEAKAEIRRLSGDVPLKGRNPFEGLNTSRIYSLLNKYDCFTKTIASLPR